jgi:hypothetical protein
MASDKSISFEICLSVGLKIRVKKVAGVVILCIFVALISIEPKPTQNEKFYYFPINL